MLRIIVTVSIAFLSTSALAESMIKAGLWEMSVIKQVRDGEDMTAHRAAMQGDMQKMMANMPPEQRKRMEQAMGNRGTANPNMHRICVSQEMASQDRPVAPANSGCQPTNFERRGNRMIFEMKCPGMIGKGESIAGGDTITTKMDMTMIDEGEKHLIQSESQMKYLGPDCQGIKPADQLAKEMQARRK
jgi:hypothetical protein